MRWSAVVPSLPAPSGGSTVCTVRVFLFLCVSGVKIEAASRLKQKLNGLVGHHFISIEISRNPFLRIGTSFRKNFESYGPGPTYVTERCADSASRGDENDL